VGRGQKRGGPPLWRPPRANCSPNATPVTSRARSHGGGRSDGNGQEAALAGLCEGQLCGVHALLYLLLCALVGRGPWDNPVTAVAGNGLVLLLLECSTKLYKPKVKDRKDTALPLIALGSGFTQPSWGHVWMRKRALAGLRDSAVIMPAMLPGGNFLEGGHDSCRGFTMVS